MSLSRLTGVGAVSGAVLLALGLAPFAAGQSAGDWPRFRGPNGSGVAAGPANTPARFTEKDYDWKIALPGLGHSSPAILGKKVFVTSGDGKSAQRFVLCIDLDTGKTLWQREYPSAPFKQNPQNSYASASPVVDAKHVYFSFTTPDSYKVYCLDHDGKDVWTYNMGPWQSQHGCGPSPIVFEDLVIVGNDQDGETASLVAIDAKTGSQRWKLDRKPGSAAHSTPCLFQPAGGGAAQVIVASTASGLTAVDAKTGKVTWVVPDAVKKRSVAGTVTDGVVCVTTSGVGGADRDGVVVQPDPNNPAAAPKALYRLPTGAQYSYVPMPLIVGELMYLWADSGTVTCVKKLTGEKVWQQKLPAPEKGRIEFFASPICAGDKLYNVSKAGEVICLRAGEKFELLGRSPLGELSYATPAVAGDRLVLRTQSHLICVGGKK